MKRMLILALFTACLVYMGCRKPFNPESIKGFSTALIVEGVINPSGATNIFLSRTLDLDDKVAVKPELKALVQVVSENNTAVILAEKGGGVYSIPQLTLNSAQKYRLKIKLASGSEYVSEAMAVRSTPPIDKFYWEREPDGVGIYVDTHDSQNNTKYYQWDFEEDWELRSVDQSEYKAVPIPSPGRGFRVISRDQNERPPMYTCYKAQRSNSIDIFSTAKLKSDIVSRHPIVFIPNTSEKLDVKYSILVRQYSLTFEAFEYLSMMKKNTEQLGSFFDSQPSELIGNIRNVNDASDLAIGYILIAPVVEKRMFITRDLIPTWPFKLNCANVSVKNDPDSLAQYFQAGGYIPHFAIQNSAGATDRWSGTGEACLDCRVRGGNNNKPAFW